MDRAHILEGVYFPVCRFMERKEGPKTAAKSEVLIEPPATKSDPGDT